jgi:hypothetical protein
MCAAISCMCHCVACMLNADSGVLQLHRQWHIDLFFFVCFVCSLMFTYTQDLYLLSI